VPVELCVTRLRYAQIHGFFSRMVAAVDHNKLARCQPTPTPARVFGSSRPTGARLRSAIHHPLPASENATMTTSLLAAWCQPGHLHRAQRPAIRLSLTGHHCRATLDIQIVAASLAEIQAGLSASPDEASWVQTSYLIAEVVMIPFSSCLSRLLLAEAYRARNLADCGRLAILGGVSVLSVQSWLMSP
jgi:hypothetical protein